MPALTVSLLSPLGVHAGWQGSPAAGAQFGVHSGLHGWQASRGRPSNSCWSWVRVVVRVVLVMIWWRVWVRTLPASMAGQRENTHG